MGWSPAGSALAKAAVLPAIAVSPCPLDANSVGSGSFPSMLGL